MTPIKILIYEHTTITKMIDFLSFLYSNPDNIKNIEPLSFDKIIDFFSMYVDKCHHGKEENILFERLKNKNLSTQNQTLMNELIEEHKLGRKLVSELKTHSSKKNYDKVKNIIFEIITLYNSHIKKENESFFYPAFKYFSEMEKSKILKEFIDFDRQIIHEKYLIVIEELKLLFK